MKRPILAALPLLALALAVPAVLPAQTAAPAAPATTPSGIIAAAPKEDWVGIAPADLVVMDLAPDAAGKPRRVVIQLMPAPFGQGWVGNIRKLIAARWYDGISVNRVQDNYVVQWGDADGEDAKKAKALPKGLATVPESDYVVARADLLASKARLRDPYGNGGFTKGWPYASEQKAREAWPIHCYGYVGVGRNLSPDTGTGAELYTVIGHAPRHLDRNIAVVGRVVQGIEHLSSLPRGTGELGFYETAPERVPIVKVRLASELPAAERPRLEYLSTESASFAAYATARANRKDDFFIRPAGGADICNIPVPVRAVK